jgi:hypothetical protein
MPSRAVQNAESKRKIRTYLGIGLLTLIILLVTLATAGREESLRCTRLESEAVDCVVRQSILGVITLNERTIAGVQAVSMGQQCVDVDCNYRLELYAIEGLVPVNEKYTTNFEQLTEIKDQLNDFFVNKTSSFVEMKEQTKPILIGGVVVVFLVIWVYLGYLIWKAQHPNEDEPGVRS